MDQHRLPAILLVGTLLTACAQFEPYRTLLPADSVPTGFECAVDTVMVNDQRPLCEQSETRDSDGSPAIQHRFYSTKDGQRGDYYLSFVEFDDQGWFAKREQMEALFALLEKLGDDEGSGGETLIYVYAHGWKHNASACDNNVVCFSRLLERTDLTEMGLNYLQGKKPRNVVGVYLGWRGLPFDSALNNFSFWSRKDTAARVGRGAVFELLTRLKDYRDSRRKNYRASPSIPGKPRVLPTQLIITGHSFGGLVIYSALSHALMERAAETTKDFGGETKYELAKSFGDFVLLVNPAFEGSMYEPLFNIATNRCYDEPSPKHKQAPEGAHGQKPVMMIVTSEADSATRIAFPVGRTLSTMFQHAKSPDQSRSMRQTAGHDVRYRTHRLESQPIPEIKRPDRRPCSCPYMTATSDLELDSMLGPAYESYIEKIISGGEEIKQGELVKLPDLYGAGVSLIPVPLNQVPSPRYTSNYPYLVVQADAGMIADHNAIYNDRFITFMQLFFTYHVVDSEPWTVQATPVSKCLYPEEKSPRTKGGLPYEQSCWLQVLDQQTPIEFNKNGSACTELREYPLNP